MRFIQNGVELKHHGDELQVRGGNEVEIKVMFRDEHLYIYHHPSHVMVIVDDEGLCSIDHGWRPIARIEASTGFPYQA